MDAVKFKRGAYQAPPPITHVYEPPAVVLSRKEQKWLSAYRDNIRGAYITRNPMNDTWVARGASYSVMLNRRVMKIMIQQKMIKRTKFVTFNQDVDGFLVQHEREVWNVL